MRTQTRTRLGWSAASALAVVMLAPELAQAQQTGLFPLAPIRRQRPPCAMEDPVYRLYRTEYFGYHPTCWRRFPSGWGCPSADAPDAAKEFKVLPRDLPSSENSFQGPDAPDAEMPANRGNTAPGPKAPTTDPLPSIPEENINPFKLDAKPIPPADRNPPAPDSPSATPGSAPAGGNAPPAPSAAREATTEEPLIALPDPTLAQPDAGAGSPPVAPAASNANASANDLGPAASLAPAQAPRRTSLLSNLFSGKGFRRR